MRYHVIRPDGRVSESGDCPPAGLPRERARELVAGELEYVKVLYDGRACHMVVNETGSTELRGPKLEPNARATAIYWTATIQGRTPARYDPLEDPLVHGTAILYEGVLP